MQSFTANVIITNNVNLVLNRNGKLPFGKLIFMWKDKTRVICTKTCTGYVYIIPVLDRFEDMNGIILSTQIGSLSRPAEKIYVQ
jgi:hypothetical protein